jgi:hypothetical protein
VEAAGVEQDGRAHTLNLLNRNSLSRVKASAARLGLDPARLRFVPGFFNVSLPALLRSESDLRFALIRLDGNTFWSTFEALETLYPRLAPGGFVVIDDYVDWAGCRAAVDAYRADHGIAAPITLVPHLSSENTRGAYWRKPLGEVAATHAAAIQQHAWDATWPLPRPVCVGAPPGQIRVDGSFNPTFAVPAGPPGRSDWDTNLPMGPPRPAYQLWKCINGSRAAGQRVREAAADVSARLQSLHASSHGTSHTRASAAPSGSLWCLLAGGLTNQENQVFNCLLVAAALERRMIVPRPVITMDGACAHPWCQLNADQTPGGGPDAFGQLWDMERFRQCASLTHGVTLLSDTDAEHAARTARSWLKANLTWARGDPAINWTFTTHIGARPWQRHVRTLSITKPHAGQGLPDNRGAEARVALRRHVPRSIDLVIAPEPFFALSSSFDPNYTCLEPARHVIERADAVRSTLPQRYACLHARLEEDWYNYCCSLHELPVDAATFEGEYERRHSIYRPRAGFSVWARHGGRGAPPTCSSSQPRPSRSCYVEAERIAAVMRKDARLPPRSVVYVASGVSESLLSPIAEAYDVRRQLGTKAQPVLSYEDALVDREVCRHASLPVFAHSRSTFSMILGRLRESDNSGHLVTVWYDRE